MFLVKSIHMNVAAIPSSMLRVPSSQSIHTEGSRSQSYHIHIPTCVSPGETRDDIGWAPQSLLTVVANQSLNDWTITFPS